MTINKNGYTAAVSQLSSLFQLTEAVEELKDSCLVIVYPQADTVVGSSSGEISAVKELFAKASFITAIACGDDTNEELADVFDLRLKSEEIDEYVEKLFKDKTKKQITEINACFTASRTSPAEKVLEIESRAFYRLMADKNGGNSNE